MQREGTNGNGPAGIKADAKKIAGGEVATKIKALEGELPEGATFLAVEQFFSMAALAEFYSSEAYQSTIPFRLDSIKMTFMLVVEGVSVAENQAERAILDQS